MTDAKASYGTVLQKGGVPIAEVTDIQGPGLALRTAEVTPHDGDGWSELIGTIKDGGDVTFTLNFLPDLAGHIALVTALTARTVDVYRIIWTDTSGTIWEFSGLVTACPPAAPVDGALTAAVTIKVTGAPDFAAV